VLEDENQRLRDRVGALMAEVDKASKDHASETHRLKKEVFNLRMQLEQVCCCFMLQPHSGPLSHSCSQTFRKAMQELDAEYKQRALSNLDNESKNALKANAKLQAELQMQTEGIEALMTKFKDMETSYTKLVRLDCCRCGWDAGLCGLFQHRKSSTTFSRRTHHCKKPGYMHMLRVRRSRVAHVMLLTNVFYVVSCSVAPLVFRLVVCVAPTWWRRANWKNCRSGRLDKGSRRSRNCQSCLIESVLPEQLRRTRSRSGSIVTMPWSAKRRTRSSA